jgi:hypothetical protein
MVPVKLRLHDRLFENRGKLDLAIHLTAAAPAISTAIDEAPIPVTSAKVPAVVTATTTN